jgi:uncharacterized protein YdaU (DUF1376 family)
MALHSHRAANADVLYRVCRAFADEERAAVDLVLQKFLVLREDGWHQDTCDEEIAKANKISGKRSEAGKKGQQMRQQNDSKRAASAEANADTITITITITKNKRRKRPAIPRKRLHPQNRVLVRCRISQYLRISPSRPKSMSGIEGRYRAKFAYW